MKVHFIIINKDLKEDYFVEALEKNNEKIIFEKNNVKTEFYFNKNGITVYRYGEMKYKQDFILNKKIKGFYEILNMNINIEALTTKMIINEKGIFIEYEQFIDDVYEGKIKIYLKY